MIKKSSTGQWDARLEEASKQYRAARRAEQDAVSSHRDAAFRHEQWRYGYEEAQKKEADVRPRDERNQRTLRDALRNLRDARQRAQPTRRFETDHRKYEADGRRSSRELKRVQDTVSRIGRELEYLADDVRKRTAILGRRKRETQRWKRTLEQVTVLRGRSAAEERETAKAEASPMPVTERAAASLRTVLGGMTHGMNETLRLSVDQAGNLLLALDTAREGGHAIYHQEQVVLLINYPLHESVLGNLLDISEASGEREFILTRVAEQAPIGIDRPSPAGHPS